MSAGKVMAYTVVVRHPETNTATAVLAGAPVPDWAKDLVHDDDLVKASDSAPGEPKAIGDMSKAELEDEIAMRNAQRPEADALKATGTKAELLAVLEADAPQV